eukprot:NODE_8811_length_366_cov_221.347267.p3 GENE.NODE_8811_length_366_cov_221.347267~~NODE_8811_length_366_cov_221.347267.p3  ORF type:complete len:56 (+),score=15.28 NODE_8811_length_366_cov_221.347267:3-170(+)
MGYETIHHETVHVVMEGTAGPTMDDRVVQQGGPGPYNEICGAGKHYMDVESWEEN